jgi:hypothetical protein
MLSFDIPGVLVVVCTVCEP